MKRLVLTALFALALAWPARADYATGYAAFQRGDYATAFQAWQVLATQGMAAAQFNLGILYAKGLGVSQDYATAAQWFRKAAEQDFAAAQFNLGNLYARGLGMPQDDVQAYVWFYVAARQGDRDAIEGLDIVAKRMSSEQVARAETIARAWQPQPQATPAPPIATTKPEPPPGLNMRSSGTGFIINRQGEILTNYHVIDDCGALTSRHGDTEHHLTVVASDPPNDLALLKQDAEAHTFATFRAAPRVRPGESVIVVGFPLRGLLALEANVTTGAVSALAGVKNDARFLQVTAPVQSGNSGGPLFDQSGHVIGVVSSKLNALRIAEAIGDMPQNVNFAIKASVAQTFLQGHAIDYHTAPSEQEQKSADVGEAARAFTLVVECWK
jgi:uncharacterized protein